jgi:hypothetical protein
MKYGSLIRENHDLKRTENVPEIQRVVEKVFWR